MSNYYKLKQPATDALTLKNPWLLPLLDYTSYYIV